MRSGWCGNSGSGPARWSWNRQATTATCCTIFAAAASAYLASSRSATVGPQDSHLFSPWGQFTVFAVYTVILLIVGGILFRRRDA